MEDNIVFYKYLFKGWSIQIRKSPNLYRSFLWLTYQDKNCGFIFRKGWGFYIRPFEFFLIKNLSGWRRG